MKKFIVVLILLTLCIIRMYSELFNNLELLPMQEMLLVLGIVLLKGIGMYLILLLCNKTLAH